VESPTIPSGARAVGTRFDGNGRAVRDLPARAGTVEAPGLDRFFEECLGAQFIEALPFTYLHVFTYSERPGNAGSGIRGQRAHSRCARNANTCCAIWRKPRTEASASA